MAKDRSRKNGYSIKDIKLMGDLKREIVARRAEKEELSWHFTRKPWGFEGKAND